MTITIFIDPKSIHSFIQVTKILQGLEIENNYRFNPSDIIYSEQMISNYIWINMDVTEYYKFKYCYSKLKK